MKAKTTNIVVNPQDDPTLLQLIETIRECGHGCLSDFVRDALKEKWIREKPAWSRLRNSIKDARSKVKQQIEAQNNHEQQLEKTEANFNLSDFANQINTQTSRSKGFPEDL